MGRKEKSAVSDVVFDNKKKKTNERKNKLTSAVDGSC